MSTPRFPFVRIAPRLRARRRGRVPPRLSRKVSRASDSTNYTVCFHRGGGFRRRSGDSDGFPHRRLFDAKTRRDARRRKTETSSSPSPNDERTEETANDRMHRRTFCFSSGGASTRLRQHDGGFPVPEHERRDDLLRLPDDHQQIRPDQTQVLLQVRHALKLETRAVPSRLGRAPCAALEEARVEAVHGQDLDVRVRRRERLGALDDVVIRQTQVVPEPHHHARRRGGHRRARVRRSRLRRSRIRRRAGGERPERGAGRGEGDARAPRACLGARERPGSGRDVRARGPVAAGRQ